MTPAAQISLPREGQSDWKLWVLMEPASKAPAFEPSVENLQALFDLVDNEITYGTVHRAKHGAATGHLRPKPRGPKGAREHAVGNRCDESEDAFSRRGYEPWTDISVEDGEDDKAATLRRQCGPSTSSEGHSALRCTGRRRFGFIGPLSGRGYGPGGL